ncbi:MAG: flagellar hook-length control protein FliK [Planctomycetota bacterium]
MIEATANLSPAAALDARPKPQAEHDKTTPHAFRNRVGGDFRERLAQETSTHRFIPGNDVAARELRVSQPQPRQTEPQPIEAAERRERPDARDAASRNDETADANTQATDDTSDTNAADPTSEPKSEPTSESSADSVEPQTNEAADETDVDSEESTPVDDATEPANTTPAVNPAGSATNTVSNDAEALGASLPAAGTTARTTGTTAPTVGTDSVSPTVVAGTTTATSLSTGTDTQGEQTGQSQTGNAANQAAEAQNGRAANAANSAAPAAFAVPTAGNAAEAPAPPGTNAANANNAANLATQATANAPLGEGPDALNEARLARGLKSALSQQGGSVTLRLTPPEMGTVRIQMQLQGTGVSAQFHAETQAAQRLLTQQLGQLRTALESQGLSVERLGVQSMSAGNASSFNGSNLQQQSQQFGQSQSDPNANPNQDGRSRGFFQQAPDDADAATTESTADEFADLVADLN